MPYTSETCQHPYGQEHNRGIMDARDRTSPLEKHRQTVEVEQWKFSGEPRSKIDKNHSKLKD